MISEIVAWLLPLVVPRVEIHTSRFDVGAPARIGMTLWPGLSVKAGASTVVSFSDPGDAEQRGGVGDRVTLHVHGHHRGPLLDGKAHQGPLHQDRRLHLRRAIGHRVDILERGGRVSLGATQPIEAGVEHDAVQPAADGGVVPKRSRPAVRREHGVLQRIFGVLA